MQQSQDLTHTLLSNLSLSQYSWEKQKRFTTDEDVLCSYSKISNVSPIKESVRNRALQKGKYPPLEESINLGHDHERDEKIKQLEEYQRWLQEQNEKMMLNQQLMIEEQAKYQSKQDKKIQELELQILTAEQQLTKSLKSQGLMEKENLQLKAKLIDLEKRLLEHDTLQSQNEATATQGAAAGAGECLRTQTAGVSGVLPAAGRLHQQDREGQQLQLSRKSSKEQIGKQYKSVVIREKSPSSNNSVYDQSQMVKFVDCIVDMVMNCTPSQLQQTTTSSTTATRPNLKKCWKWLKNILEDYMALKKQSTSSKSSAKCSQLELEKERRRDTSSFFQVNDVNKRFQTSIEDSENKFLRSNTLLARVNNNK